MERRLCEVVLAFLCFCRGTEAHKSIQHSSMWGFKRVCGFRGCVKQVGSALRVRVKFFALVCHFDNEVGPFHKQLQI